MPAPIPTLRASLERHNDVFESLLKLIPAQYYIVNDASEEQAASKYQKHSRKQKLSKQVIKEDIDMEDMHGSGGDVKPLPESTGIEILREKLHAKMALLRSRGRPVDREAGDKEDLLEERRRQRAAMRERRRKETREKIRREEEMKAKSSKNKQRDKSQPTNTQLLVANQPLQLGCPRADLTAVAYSSIAGHSKTGQHLKTTADPQQALHQLSARKEKLSSMPEEKRKAVEEKEKWTKAEARLEGVKIHDDEIKLKKAAKRKEKEKAKSKATWDTKKEQVQAAMAARQKKRDDNIAQRNERRKDKKKGVSKKARPGFEGKAFGTGKKASNKGK